MIKISEEQIEFIHRNYHKISRLELATHLNLTIHQIKRLLKKLNFKKKKQNSIRFSDEEFLSAIKSSKSHTEAARKLGYTRQSGLKTNYGLAVQRLKPDISHFKLLSRSRIIKNSGSIEAFYNIYKARAIKNQINFSLTLKQFTKLVTNKCYYCNNTGNTFAGYKTKNIYCGIDKVNPQLGYIKSNCKPCCKRCNFMKSNLSQEIFLSHIKSIYENLC